MSRHLIGRGGGREDGGHRTLPARRCYSCGTPLSRPESGCWRIRSAMADQNMIKRGLGGQVRDTARETRSREEAKEARDAKRAEKGEGGGSAIGKAAKKAAGKAKAGLDR